MKKTKTGSSRVVAGTKQPGKVSAKSKPDAKGAPGVNLQRRSVETRDRIIAAAVHGFATLGYEGYSARMISIDSKTHHSLVIYHFGSKLGLWKATALKLLRDLRGRIEERRFMAGPIDDPSTLRVIFEEFIRYNAACPEFPSIMLDAAAHPDDRFDWIMDTLGQGATKYWVSLIRTAQAAGRFVPGDPQMLLQVYLGAAMRVYLMAPEVERNMGMSPFNPEFVEKHLKTCMDLFFIEPKAGAAGKSRRSGAGE